MATSRTIAADQLSTCATKKVVVLGSSTAAGAGAWPSSNSWVNLYAAYNKTLNSAHAVTNLAAGGYTTYHILPTGTTATAGRPGVDTSRNITAAIAQRPQAIIVNLPSNDYAAGYSIAESHANFKTISNAAAQAGIPIWITTTQPRNLSSANHYKLLETKTWIQATYGNRSMNFYTPIADSRGYIRPEYDAGDGTHLNNTGHRKVYEQALASTMLAAICAAEPYPPAPPSPAVSTDLVVTAINMTPANPAPGQAVSFSAVVRNQGNAATPAGIIHGVNFKVNDVQVSWSNTHTGSIPARGSVTLTANTGPGGIRLWNATPGTHTATAHVDILNRITRESNEANNILYKRFTVGRQPPVDTKPPTVSLTSPASGVNLAGSVNVSAHASDTTGVSRVEFMVDGVLKNTDSAAPYGFNWNSAEVSNGTHVLTARAYDTAGNTATTGGVIVTTRNAGLPVPDIDLLVTDVTMTPAVPIIGQAVAFSAVVRNQGSTATPAGAVHGIKFIVNNVPISWNNTNTASIPAGASVLLTANSGPRGADTWTVTTGLHTLRALVDDRNRIAGETNETNNTFSETLSLAATTPVRVPGDANQDGIVNLRDVGIVIGKWGTAGSAGDVNQDGAIDIIDIAVALMNLST